MKRREDSASRARITTLPILPGTLVLGGCLLAAFLILLFLIYKSGMLPVPAPLARLIHGEEQTKEPDRFAESFLRSLEGRPADTEGGPGRLLSLGEEDLLSLLLAAERADTLYQALTVTWVDGEAYRTAQIYALNAGERMRAEVFSSGQLEKFIVADAQSLYVWEHGAAAVFPRRADSGFTPESEIGMPSLSDIQKKLAAARRGEYVLTLRTVRDAPGIFTVFTDPATGVEETYEILPDCGAVISAYCRLPDAVTPYYILTTEQLMTDVSRFDDSVFDIPNP